MRLWFDLVKKETLLNKLSKCNKRYLTWKLGGSKYRAQRAPVQSMVSFWCKRDIFSWKKSYFKISMLFKVLPFHIKIYPVEIFTRATPGSCLVFHIGPSRFTDFIFASQSLRLPHQIWSCFMYSLHSLQDQIPIHLTIHPTLWFF